jgi:hypothetical protein
VTTTHKKSCPPQNRHAFAAPPQKSQRTPPPLSDATSPAVPLSGKPSARVTGASIRPARPFCAYAQFDSPPPARRRTPPIQTAGDGRKNQGKSLETARCRETEGRFMARKQNPGVPPPPCRVYFAPVRQPTRDRLHRDRRQAGKGTWRAPLTISELVARARKYLGADLP